MGPSAPAFERKERISWSLPSSRSNGAASKQPDIQLQNYLTLISNSCAAQGGLVSIAFAYLDPSRSVVDELENSRKCRWS
jgi:hypothetical protein